MSKITSISQKGLDLIKEFEGYEPKAYLCPANVPTIGYGTTRYPNGQKVKLSDPEITEQQAEEYLRNDVRQFELAVDALCRDDINQNNFDALTSFCYNCGSNALKTSTLLKRVNSKQGDIRAAFMMWCKADGKVVKGLKIRRSRESDLYLSTLS